MSPFAGSDLLNPYLFFSGPPGPALAERALLKWEVGGGIRATACPTRGFSLQSTQKQAEVGKFWSQSAMSITSIAGLGSGGRRDCSGTQNPHRFSHSLKPSGLSPGAQTLR